MSGIRPRRSSDRALRVHPRDGLLPRARHPCDESDHPLEEIRLPSRTGVVLGVATGTLVIVAIAQANSGRSETPLTAVAFGAETVPADAEAAEFIIDVACPTSTRAGAPPEAFCDLSYEPTVRIDGRLAVSGEVEVINEASATPTVRVEPRSEDWTRVEVDVTVAEDTTDQRVALQSTDSGLTATRAAASDVDVAVPVALRPLPDPLATIDWGDGADELGFERPSESEGLPSLPNAIAATPDGNTILLADNAKLRLVAVAASGVDDLGVALPGRTQALDVDKDGDVTVQTSTSVGVLDGDVLAQRLEAREETGGGTAASGADKPTPGDDAGELVMGLLEPERVEAEEANDPWETVRTFVDGSTVTVESKTSGEVWTLTYEDVGDGLSIMDIEQLQDGRLVAAVYDGQFMRIDLIDGSGAVVDGYAFDGDQYLRFEPTSPIDVSDGAVAVMIPTETHLTVHRIDLDGSGEVER